jgi:hypothetical protein
MPVGTPFLITNTLPHKVFVDPSKMSTASRMAKLEQALKMNDHYAALQLYRTMIQR